MWSGLLKICTHLWNAQAKCNQSLHRVEHGRPLLRVPPVHLCESLLTRNHEGICAAWRIIKSILRIWKWCRRALSKIRLKVAFFSQLIKIPKFILLRTTCHMTRLRLINFVAPHHHASFFWIWMYSIFIQNKSKINPSSTLSWYSENNLYICANILQRAETANPASAGNMVKTIRTDKKAYSEATPNATSSTDSLVKFK